MGLDEAGGAGDRVAQRAGTRGRLAESDVHAGAGEVRLAVLAVLALGWPGLALFDRPATLFGIPLLFLYVFAAWAALIVLVRAWMHGADED